MALNAVFVSLVFNGMVANNTFSDPERGIDLEAHAAMNKTLVIEPRIRNNNTVVVCRAYTELINNTDPTCIDSDFCCESDSATLIIITNGTSPETESGPCGKDNILCIAPTTTIVPTCIVVLIVVCIICCAVWRRRREAGGGEAGQ